MQDTKPRGGGVVISPHLQKETVFIDDRGNEVRPYTKQVIKKKEAEYVPPANLTQPTPQPTSQSAPQSTSTGGLKDIIKKQVEDAVKEQIKSIDINGMVAEAMKEAFK